MKHLIVIDTGIWQRREDKEHAVQVDDCLVILVARDDTIFLSDKCVRLLPCKNLMVGFHTKIKVSSEFLFCFNNLSFTHNNISFANAWLSSVMHHFAWIWRQSAKPSA